MQRKLQTGNRAMTFRLIPATGNRAFRFAISTALAAGLLTGCSAAGPHPSKFAAGAQSALNHGQTDKAIALAEQAVQADGRNASLRLLLANAYLRAGRFESARQTYDDAMELGEDGGKTALSLALAQIGMGHNAEAVDTLNTYRDALPAADYGLAMAMAGRVQEGVNVLTDALRRGENTPKIRQNLAFAYALGGSWAEAKIMAAQDVPADQLGARMQEWAAMGAPEDQRMRVASLIGAPLRGDEGQPAMLALANFPADGSAPVRQADAPTAADAPALAQAAVEELPAVAQGDAPAPALADASSQPKAAQLARIDLPASQAAAPAAAKPYRVVGSHVARPQAAPAPAVAVSNGSHVVQLGAFATEEGARRAWRHYAARNPSLKGHAPIIARVTVRGREFWRVQAAGFTGFASARSMCGTVKSRGGACLVMVSPTATSPQGRPVEARFARR
ncbi:SPOR domain-containing protein [Novosphingobium cyanobacteriorum]|uniref:SPOR domain-containing protein n=1 Tax=Novosphingobium cyanobacteriorum TaxID=3024215 RepID=A0ABT6CK93_9SPHN|nr:SPOR domain-containing protein [Novosphingobium cyanobacteriorum]MDF8334242.1 SPOR domain-containing protein [Novosphingobium cyanobacteriorum]